MGFLCLKKKSLEAASALLQDPTSRKYVVQGTAPSYSSSSSSSRSNKLQNQYAAQRSPTGSSAIKLALVDTRYARNAATTRKSPSFFLVVLSPRKGVAFAKIRSVAARVRACSRSSSSNNSSSSSSSSSRSSSSRKQQQQKQQQPQAAASSACNSACSSACLWRLSC